MKICVTNFSDLDEPTTINAFYLAEELAKRGHEVTMLLPKMKARYITRSKKARLKYFGVIRFPREAKIVSQAAAQTFRALGQKFDIIQAFKPLIQSALPAVVASTLKGGVKVLYWDDYEVYGQRLSQKSNPLYTLLIGRLERRFLKIFDGVLCVSPFLADIAKTMLASERVLLIPNGFDKDVFKLESSGEDIRKKLGVKKTESLIVYTGGLKPWADIDLLIQAMSHITKKMPNSFLALVGEGEAKRELSQLCQQLGIFNKVIFAGGVPHAEVPKYLAAADVLALPLRNNIFNQARFPNRIAEYMAAGRPIVTNGVGVAGDLFKDGHNAVVIDSEHPEEFAEGILRALVNKKKAEEMGARAKEYAWNNFTWDKIATRVEEFYLRVLKMQKARSS